MAQANRPGDVLAGRYRLEDLLQERGAARFWRAHDAVLARHVAVHVVDDEDPRSDALLDAARRAAGVADRRLLRVLDADRRDGTTFVVHEWGRGTSLDLLLAEEGPLSARRAAWIVAEAAEALATAHAAGVPHGCVVPEHLLVDPGGAVRIVGHAVDAALAGRTAPTEDDDVAGLAGCLYAALTGRWPGPGSSAVPPAPVEDGAALRPRQVRAGVPRPLDAICSRLLRGAGPDDVPLGARDLAAALRDVVGDPAGLVAAEAERQAGRHGTGWAAAALPPEPDDATLVVPAAAPAPTPDPTPDPTPTPAPPTTPTPDPAESAPGAGESSPSAGESAPGAVGTGELQRTEAGMPVFGATGEHDDVAWLRTRSTPPPPPPPFEAPPERPLFAASPDGGAPVRRPRTDVPSAAPTGAGDPYWPWDTGTATVLVGAVPAAATRPRGRVPGRTGLRVAAVVALVVVVLVAVVAAYNLGRGRSLLGALPEDEPSSTPSASARPARPVEGVVATDLDPQGTDGGENTEDAPLAVDGDPATAWTTSSYEQDFGPAGLKTGVGLLLDLGRSRSVRGLEAALAGPTGFEVYVVDGDTPPTDVAGLRPAGRGSTDGGTATVDLDAQGRWVVLWLTDLPGSPGAFRGQVSEVSVLG